MNSDKLCDLSWLCVLKFDLVFIQYSDSRYININAAFLFISSDPNLVNVLHFICCNRQENGIIICMFCAEIVSTIECRMKMRMRNREINVIRFMIKLERRYLAKEETYMKNYRRIQMIKPDQEKKKEVNWERKQMNCSVDLDRAWKEMFE